MSAAYSGYMDNVRLWNAYLPMSVLHEGMNKHIHSENLFYQYLIANYSFDRELADDHTGNHTGSGIAAAKKFTFYSSQENKVLLPASAPSGGSPPAALYLSGDHSPELTRDALLCQSGAER